MSIVNIYSLTDLKLYVLNFQVPIVVTTVLAKKKDCPKLQEGTLVLIPFDPSAMGARVTPRLSASTMAFIRSSREEAK